MIAAATCSLDWVARARQARLSGRIDEELRTHFRQCSECRHAHLLSKDFQAVIAVRPGDERMVDSVADAVLVQFDPSGPRVLRRDARPGHRPWYLLAAAILMISMSAAAGVATFRRTDRSRDFSSTTVRTHTIVLKPAAATEVNHPARVIDETNPPPPPTTQTQVVTRAFAHISVVSHEARPEQSDRERPARELFVEANASRRAGNEQHARSLYIELQRRYPTATETLVSRVSYGRLLLDQLNDPAGALTQFDLYLGQSTHTALDEEALFYRATAQMRLRRFDDERATWRLLLARYPASIHVDRARSRLASDL